MLYILFHYFNPTLTLFKARLQPYFKHILKVYMGNYKEKMDN